jgi:hypothetical protein
MIKLSTVWKKPLSGAPRYQDPRNGLETGDTHCHGALPRPVKSSEPCADHGKTADGPSERVTRSIVRLNKGGRWWSGGSADVVRRRRFIYHA